jgi:hypothetical protein
MTPGGVCCESVTAVDFFGEFVTSMNTDPLNLYKGMLKGATPLRTGPIFAQIGELALAGASVAAPYD